jgi:hypothetical protein
MIKFVLSDESGIYQIQFRNHVKYILGRATRLLHCSKNYSNLGNESLEKKLQAENNMKKL